jgi:hypothetical protein
MAWINTLHTPVAVAELARLLPFPTPGSFGITMQLLALAYRSLSKIRRKHSGGKRDFRKV